MPFANLPKVQRLLPQENGVTCDFNHHFQQQPTVIAAAPGRINLIGEHTDYNQGFVLPAAIDKKCFLAVSLRNDNKLTYLANDLGEVWASDLSLINRPQKHWSDYINAVLHEFHQMGVSLKGMDLVISSTIPIGAGMSSSAALECGTALALSELYRKPMERMEMARLAQSAENNFVGVKCGIMDPFASLFGQAEQVVLLDCRSMKYEYIPVDLHEYSILLIDTGIKHSLASGEYNIRREQCEAGVKALRKIYPQVNSLRDANRAMIEYSLKDRVPDLIYNRCKYVVEENLRLQVGADALRRQDLVGFGKKMFATHAGLSKLFEVSCRELDFLVDLARDEHAVIGARLMGGGFGGSTINIVRKPLVNEVTSRMGEAYRKQFGNEPDFHLCQLSDGASLLPVA